MCVSTHLTTVATVDQSALERIVEDKVLTVAGRVEQMFGVEMNPAINEPNWFVISTTLSFITWCTGYCIVPRASR